MAIQPIYLNVKGKKEKYAILTTPSQDARGRVSRENRQEYDNEKRAKEISKRFNGPVHAKSVAVAHMMDIPEHQARKLIERKSGVVLDGKID